MEFIRLAERNDLRESEGQQAARYLEGLKPQIRDKISMQMLQNLHEAKNMALMAEFMLQEKGRYDSSRRNYGGENSRAPIDKRMVVQESQSRND